jgi:hypothetical protein
MGNIRQEDVNTDGADRVLAKDTHERRSFVLLFADWRSAVGSMERRRVTGAPTPYDGADCEIG